MVDAVGAEELGHAVLDFLHTVADFDSGFVILYHRRRTPTVLAEALAHPLRRNEAAAYLAGPYLLDPFRLHAQRLRDAAVVRLRDITSPDFLSSEYYRSYYVHSHLVDEVNLLVPVAPFEVVATCIGRSQAMPPFRSEELAPLEHWLPLVSAVMRKHIELGAAQPESFDAHSGEREHSRLEARLAAFGADVLTPRECEVVQLLLAGCAAKDIARSLDLSVQTVRVHRRNIYDKLGVSSLGQLFSMATRSLLGSATG